MDGKQFAEHRRQRGHYTNARGYAEHASGQAQPQRLQQEDSQQIAGTGAYSLQDGQHVHALLEMSVHGHGDTNRTQHHGHKANEAKNCRCVVQAFVQSWIALAKIHNLRIGQSRFHLFSQRGKMGRRIGLRGNLSSSR